ncbi:hypothetical protein JHK85_001583 [Glycine max]|nr:hypothetical protein JHK85_001583 [Glycine max]KAG5088930.1 hypothetical protein JHK86_001542 [Glycine max]
MVNDLIDVGQGCWNNRLEKACMHHDDAQNNHLTVVILHEFLHEQGWEYLQRHSDGQVRSIEIDR